MSDGEGRASRAGRPLGALLTILEKSNTPKGRLRHGDPVIGTEYGQWLVLSKVERSPGQTGNTKYLCRCTNDACGKEQPVRGTCLVTGRSTQCRRCASVEVNKSVHRIRERLDSIPRTKWRGIKRNARLRDLEFDITLEWAWELFVAQGGRCALTGVAIHFAGEDEERSTASLDRIDSNRGYTCDNVQWVHTTVNLIKRDLPEEEFFSWCRLVTEQRDIRQKGLFLAA